MSPSSGGDPSGRTSGRASHAGGVLAGRSRGQTGRAARKAGFTIRVSGRFLELTGILHPCVPAGADGGVTADVGSQRPSSVLDLLQISVPKRLVRAAVRRNTVKRVVREAWRLGPDILHVGDRIWRFRLKAHPMGPLAARSQHARAQLRQQARRALQAGATSAQASSVRSGAVAAHSLSGGSSRSASAGAGDVPVAVGDPAFSEIKRQLRVEADRLLLDAVVRMQRHRQPVESAPSTGGVAGAKAAPVASR